MPIGSSSPRSLGGPRPSTTSVSRSLSWSSTTPRVYSVCASLQRLKEAEQRGAVLPRRLPERLARRHRLAAVPQDRLGDRARAAIVEERRLGLDDLDQAQAPQRRRPPLD